MPPGRLDVGDFAEGLAEQAFADGRFHRDLLGGEVGFVFGDEGVRHFPAIAHVLDRDTAEDKGL